MELAKLALVSAWALVFVGLTLASITGTHFPVILSGIVAAALHWLAFKLLRG